MLSPGSPPEDRSETGLGTRPTVLPPFLGFLLPPEVLKRMKMQSPDQAVAPSNQTQNPQPPVQK